MKKYYLSGFLILLVGLFAYHFYAADRAERNIDNAIQKLSQQAPSPLSTTYSNISVYPFSGDVVISNLNLIGTKIILRAESAQFDFVYSDFISIEFKGAEKGLRSIEQGAIHFKNLSYTDRSTLSELKSDSLTIVYRGSIWELIRPEKDGIGPLALYHIETVGKNVRFTRPESAIGSLQSDWFSMESHLKHSPSAFDSIRTTFGLEAIRWVPSSSFQESYRFFIEGFGFQSDRIPFDSLNTQLSISNDRLEVESLELFAPLFQAEGKGSLVMHSELFADSDFEETHIRFFDFAPRLSNFLSNAEKLFGVRLPLGNDGISLQVTGTIDNPEVNVMIR